MLRCKPFYRKNRRCWYVLIRGTEHKLGSDREAAFKAFHLLMSTDAPVTINATVADLIERFLTWMKENRKKSTHEWYRNHCSSFVKHVGRRLKVSDLKGYHVDGWLKVHGTNKSKVTTGSNAGRSTKNTGRKNSKTYLNGGCRAIARAMNWAKKQGHITTSPIVGMERPAAKPRTTVLTTEQWEELVALVDPSDPFRDLLVFLWETGVRPYEARMARADNFLPARRQLVLDLKDSKGEEYQRVIQLNARAFEIVSRLASEGFIFKHKNGGGWAGRSLQCRFTKLSETLGFKVIPYAIRHSWITNALLRGVDPLTVGILAGHRDATMVLRVYNHLAQNQEFLAAKLRQATGEDAA